MNREFKIIGSSLVALGLGAIVQGCADKDRAPVEQTEEPTERSRKVEFLAQLDERLGHIRETLTERHTSLLKGYKINNTEVTQYLWFKNSDLKPVFSENENDEEGLFLQAKDGRELFTYEMGFGNGLHSRLMNGILVDLVGRRMNILGDSYTITEALQNDREFSMTLEGPRQIKLFHPTSDGSFVSSGLSKVEIDGNIIENAKLQVGSGTHSPGIQELGYIGISIEADTFLGDLYVPLGEGLRQHMDEPEGMLSDHWDIQYVGHIGNGIHKIRFVGPESENVNETLVEPNLPTKFPFMAETGLFYDLNLVENVYGINVSTDNGQSKRRLHFYEAENEGDPNVKSGDLFVLTGPDGFTHILGITMVHYVNRVLTIKDRAVGGQTREWAFDGNGRGSFIYSGREFAFKMNLDGSSQHGNIAIDQNGDKSFNGAQSPLVDLTGRQFSEEYLKTVVE